MANATGNKELGEVLMQAIRDTLKKQVADEFELKKSETHKVTRCP